MFLIVLAIFLDSIVGQVDVLIAEIVKIKHLAARSDVSLFVPIALQNAVDARQQYIVADIKFAIIVEKGLVYI
jgi:hypothetical protein